MNKLVKVAGLVTAFVIADNSSFAQQEKEYKIRRCAERVASARQNQRRILWHQYQSSL
jgi:TolB-like protein